MVQLKGEKQVELLPDNILYKDISGRIYTDESLTRNGFKSEYYNTPNLTGKLFKTSIEQNIDYTWKYGAPFEGMPAAETVPVRSA